MHSSSGDAGCERKSEDRVWRWLRQSGDGGGRCRCMWAVVESGAAPLRPWRRKWDAMAGVDAIAVTFYGRRGSLPCQCKQTQLLLSSRLPCLLHGNHDVSRMTSRLPRTWIKQAQRKEPSPAKLWHCC